MNRRGKMYFVILKDVERKDEEPGAKGGSIEAEGKR
jgi:hypothetical protein